MKGAYLGPLSALRQPAAWPDVVVACVWLPRLALGAELLRHPEWNGLPIAMGGGSGQRKVVQLVSPEAEAAGIHPGLPLRDVLACSREAIVLEPDPARVANVIDEVLACLQRVGPAVEAANDQPLETNLSGSGLHSALFLDLNGLEQVYGGDLDLLERAIRSVVPPLLQLRLGFGGGKFAASVAAQVAPPDGRCVVSAGETAAFLAPLSVHYLPFPPETWERLDLLAIETIGQLAKLPFSAVQAQFGKPGARCWTLANGRDAEPLLPRPYSPSVKAFLRCDEPIASLEVIMLAIEQLLTRAYADPVLRGGSARQLRLRALLASGSSWERSFTFKEALAGFEAARRALWGKLKAANMLPAAPVEELSLELLGLGPETGRQLPLFGNRWKQEEQIEEAARQLAARYGQAPLYRAVEVEPWSRIPERRWALTRIRPRKIAAQV
ncbi:MAG: DNA polymerase Y family protein [Chloroflexi bacterium]|nr:DNA polymerase Y family protein [Chloroflexota bacterium]